MAVESADDLATFFDTDEFGVAATYTPSGGSATAVTVWIMKPQEIQALGLAGIRQHNITGLLRKSEAADPAGGTLVVSGTTYQIVEPEIDETDKIWSFGLHP